MAEIIIFRPHSTKPCPYGDFRKALIVVTLLMHCDAAEALQLIALWVACGLLSEDEAAALHAFYGWEHSA